MSKENSAPKKKLELCVNDIDSCITDFYGLVTKTSGVVMTEIQKEFNIPRKQLVDEIQGVAKTASCEYYFHNPVKLFEVLPCLKDKDEKKKAKILHNWDVNRRKLTKLYPGVKEAFSDIRKAGGKVVLLSDSPLTPAIVRLKLLGMKPEDVDAVYVRSDPNIPGDKRPLMEYDQGEASFAKEMMKKTIVIPDEFRKPLPEIISFIAKDQGAREDRTCMVGDTDKDVTCCVGNKAISVLQEQGATMDKATTDLFEELSVVPGYRIGIDAVNEKLKKQGIEPDVRLGLEGYANMSKHFEYVPVSEKANEANLNRDDKESTVAKILRNRDKHKAETKTPIIDPIAAQLAELRRNGRH